jgi:hypothetical protein
MRLQPGRITNLDWLYEVRNSRGFTYAAAVGPVVGNFSHVQLFNPVASPVTMLVRLVVAALLTTGTLLTRTFAAALAGAPAAGVNLNLGAAAGSGVIRVENNVGILGTYIGELPLLANTPLQTAPDWYFMLGAGEGVGFVPAAVNVGVAATFFWVEF